MELEQLLHKHFGYSSFRPGQKEVIEALLQEQDVIALLPTGMGKSLCYQLPAYILEKPVLIVSPLLSLMQDQVEELKRFGEKRVIALNSFLSQTEKRYVLHYLEQYRFIFTSPEMLLQQQVQEKLAQMKLGLIVVDEAHCISQWGFDFRPDYLRIGEWFSRGNRPPILALSATATDKVVRDIRETLSLKAPFEFMYNVDRANIHLGRIVVEDKADKARWLMQHIKETAGPGILYVSSRKRAQQYSEALLQAGIRTAAYHAGYGAEDRQFIQQQFIDGELDWIVATNAFGMGINKLNIRQVIHESMPANIANYMQEIGRAGRDGQSALAILLYSEGDEELAKFVVTGDLPTPHHVDRYQELLSQQIQPTQMLKNGELSETAFRVLDYWVQQESSEQVKARLNHLALEKYSAVNEMLKIIQTKDCIREHLVGYFGQKLQKKPENCCENCGIHYDEIKKTRLQEDKKIEMVSWESRLQQLLMGI
ncbi:MULTISPECIES: RecQ family ATP-dependent DNA helicase [unclassified Lysinibacillus]|uniref:RecQ family ATP-dependent DNA helicase n=1 Tax=unclassified Lysinibacillus TaxID=2636778 RepID=UPI000738BF09|nr:MULTISPECIES: ATP-dependent DNA helicase RecQ [unclassified Lysinibacillus]KUF33133.1 ATP-dependent DNA helicase [Lysinibacillus sp. F5]WCH49128.1 ATP-dependent DNA helicase [Lysinibacillus sp. OF-1]SCY63694.1 ATP-dependent DNA helicase RecQ [Lysinibacillus sp. SG9]SDB25531.1 ATP-dependent DNA helicase RecQ [Lysinibacillus sp. TC-37]SFS83642.1 ATP-dependent DNA helicase RecQ [Lysinibacillus sp. SG55]